MAPNNRTNLPLMDLLNAANRYYSDEYVAHYFDAATGMPKGDASGDSLAGFIVNEISETFSVEYSRAEQIAIAIRALERALNDIQSAIDGLKQLQ